MAPDFTEYRELSYSTEYKVLDPSALTTPGAVPDNPTPLLAEALAEELEDEFTFKPEADALHCS
ncbi:MAG: hypothetical protein V4671_12625 [Armatimonadota bacterium]